MIQLSKNKRNITNNWFIILSLEEAIQKVIFCHPQLDWGSNNSLCAIQLRDSLFQGNDTN